MSKHQHSFFPPKAVCIRKVAILHFCARAFALSPNLARLVDEHGTIHVLTTVFEAWQNSSTKSGMALRHATRIAISYMRSPISELFFVAYADHESPAQSFESPLCENESRESHRKTRRDPIQIVLRTHPLV